MTPRNQHQVQFILRQPGVWLASFHQCQFGLQAPSGKFFKKKTSILTNSAALWRRFDGKICESDHQHQKIEGCEQGHKRSQLAQVYPDGMCSAIASAVMQEASGATGF